MKRFRFEVDRKRALCGQLLIRYLINSVFDVPLREIIIERTEKNKPYYTPPKHSLKIPGDEVNKELVDNSRFNFNISHHGSWVVLVWHQFATVGNSRRLSILYYSKSTLLPGVDVMDYKEREPSNEPELEEFFSVFQSYFTPTEWEFIKKPEAMTMELQRFYQ